MLRIRAALSFIQVALTSVIHPIKTNLYAPPDWCSSRPSSERVLSACESSNSGLLACSVIETTPDLSVSSATKSCEAHRSEHGRETGGAIHAWCADDGSGCRAFLAAYLGPLQMQVLCLAGMRASRMATPSRTTDMTINSVLRGCACCISLTTARSGSSQLQQVARSSVPPPQRFCGASLARWSQQ